MNDDLTPVTNPATEAEEPNFEAAITPPVSETADTLPSADNSATEISTNALSDVTVEPGEESAEASGRGKARARRPRRRRRGTGLSDADSAEAATEADALATTHSVSDPESFPEPTPEPVEDSAEPDTTPSPKEAVITVRPLSELELVEAGEPIPLLRRELVDGEKSVLELEGAILVPEADVEEALPPLFPAPAVTRTTQAAPILPITPEILAEVRSEIEARETAAPVVVRKVQAKREQPAGRAPVPPPAPTPEPAPDELMLLVPEALYETPVVEAEAEAVIRLQPEAEPALAPGGRRKRRRGRERERGRAVEPTPVAAAPTPAIVAPTATVTRAEEEPIRLTDRERRDRTYKEILVNVGERETRIALLEDGRLMELHVEREERVVGGVYKGRVSNVLPGMDAAFVDIGLERNAFLYVGDILFDDPTNRKNDDGMPLRRTNREVKIKDVAKPGQEILVQVVKGPRGTKGARVSTKISIPGRYLVLMPDADHLGVSRKVEDPKERERLRKIAEHLRPRGYGLIVRTEAEGRTEAELHQDLDYLVSSWAEILEKNKRAPAPSLLHKDLSLILKTIRDLFGTDVDKLVIDSEEEYEKVIGVLSRLAPDLVDRVIHYDEPEPLFIKYHVEEEIDRLLRRKIWLRNGAYLLLDTTEALTTIDVNTGKFVGTSSLQETILKTNLDAVDEIARQLRLRDIGGMIVLDFIDMNSSRDRQLVMRRLEEAFKRDRTRIKIAHISPLGLVEMTRKRTAEAVTDVMSQPCPYCQGRGRVWSPETMAIQIERDILRTCAQQQVEAIIVYANPEVAGWLIGPEGEAVEQLERTIRRPVYVRARHDYHIEKFEILPGDMMELERQMMPFRGGQVVECLVTKLDLITPPRSSAWADGFFVDLANGIRYQGQRIRVRLTDVRRSFALGEPLAPPTAIDRSEPI